MHNHCGLSASKPFFAQYRWFLWNMHLLIMEIFLPIRPPVVKEQSWCFSLLRQKLASRPVPRLQWIYPYNR